VDITTTTKPSFVLDSAAEVMMGRRWLVGSLALLVAVPAYGQDLRSSVNRAVSQAARQQQSQPAQAGGGGRVPPGLLWTGIGLLGAGGLFLGLGAAEDPDNETCVSGDDFEETCISNRTALLATGGVMAGTGGALLAIGFAKRSSPQVTFGRGGVAIRQPVPIDLGIARLVRR
jgi:hypothetical protein